MTASGRTRAIAAQTDAAGAPAKHGPLAAARGQQPAMPVMGFPRQHLTQRMRAELFDKIDGKLQLCGRASMRSLPDTKGAFRFAREPDDEVSELPNPLTPRRAIN
jgi:hypothetical protein